MAEPRTISGTRHALALAALYEVGEIAQALRRHIRDHDSAGEIEPLSRGMLRRTLELSDAICECLGHGDGVEDADLLKIVDPAPRWLRDGPSARG